MIAIAGAKGGCGKTVTTIGLAEAVGRRGQSVIAIDADCQLPNLHVAGGVQREPTLAALESEPAAVESVVQSSPRTANTGLISAPEPSDRIDFDATYDRLEADRVFVDCPSGAGPDVVEPLSAADGVIVVTTDTERSLAAAETTLGMACRLEVPILGAVLNRCENVPQTTEPWAEVPILGTVPDGSSPLTNEATCAAYDEIARTLERRIAPDRTPVEYDDDLLPTGIDEFDRAVGGGLTPGSMVAVVANPASQSEQVLYGATAVRGTLYLSTERSPANVERALESGTVETGNPTIRRLDGDSKLEDAAAMIEKLPASSTLLIDPVNSLEAEQRADYVGFLDDLKDRLVATESVGLLHCLEGSTQPAHRAATIHAVDAVFEIESSRSGGDVEHSLWIPKFRADGPFTSEIELEFDDGQSTAVDACGDRS